MCNKTNLTKRFFVLFHHPMTAHKPIQLGLLKDTPLTQTLYKSNDLSFLLKQDVEQFGYKFPLKSRCYMVPIEVPRDWFLH